MTTSLVSAFSVDAFNSVKDYHDIRALGESDKKLPEMIPIINKFGAVFGKHHKEDNAALSLTHRHFKLLQGEKKVAWQCDAENKFHIRAVAEGDIELKSGEKLLPYHFLPVADGTSVSLIPLEFVIHRKPERIAALERDIAAICDEDFLRSFLDTARDNKVDGVYGLVLPSRAFLDFDKTIHTTVEGSGGAPRTLVIEVSDKTKLKDNDDFTTVAWRFAADNEGRIVPWSACSSLRHDDAQEPNVKGHTANCAGIHGCCNHCYHNVKGHTANCVGSHGCCNHCYH